MSSSHQRAVAKSLYLRENMTLAEISERSGMNINTLKYYIDKGSKSEKPWKEIKKLGMHNELAEILQDDQVDLNSIYNLGLGLVQRSLAQMEVSDTTLDVKGVDRLLSALDKIDRWKRLEEAKKEVDADNLDELTDAEQLMSDMHVFFKTDNNVDEGSDVQ